MGKKLGKDAKLYRNTVTYESPSWEEMDNVIDLTLNDKPISEVDFLDRAASIKQIATTGREWDLSFNVHVNPADENYTTLRDAVANGDEVEFLCLDGPVETTGSSGVRFSGVICDFNRGEPRDGKQTRDVVAKPGLGTTPEYYEVE